MWPFKPKIVEVVKEKLTTEKVFIPLNTKKVFILIRPYSEYMTNDDRIFRSAYDEENLHAKVFQTADAAASVSKGRFLICEVELCEVEPDQFREVSFGKREYQLCSN